MNPYIYIAVFAVSFALGMFSENQLHLAGQTVAAFEQTKEAQKGETALINDTQNLTKDIHNAKDPCINAIVPPGINHRLR